MLPWIGLVVAAFTLTLFAVGPLRDYLLRRGQTDSEGERTSHVGVVPRGGGLVVTPVVLLSWLFAGHGLGLDRVTLIAIGGGVVILFFVSWRDDIEGLPALTRLITQIGVVGGTLLLVPLGPVFQGMLPVWADSGLTALLWIGFLNIFNFMDGMDGITGGETVAIGVGTAVVVAMAGSASNLPPALSVLGLTAAAAAIAFLRWNWHPASIFLGDTGSIPLGFMLGWLLLTLAAAGHWAPALILSLYYLADGGLTLLRRILRLERIWTPHREHFYQRAFAPGDDQRPIIRPILAANACLIGLAAVAAAGDGIIWTPLMAAVAVVAALLLHLERLARARTRIDTEGPAA